MTCPNRILVALLACTLLSACLPYAVGSTPQTVAPGERTSNVLTYIIPQGVEDMTDSSTTRTQTLVGIDNEIRFGLSPRSDVGVRVPNLSGIVVTYKQRIDRTEELAEDGGGLYVAVMPGVGFVNIGQHAHEELTLLASAAAPRTVLPYGGVRGMQVIPLSSEAVSDSPTLGGFAGVRIGTQVQAVSPELGFYYDRSALNLRSST